MTQQQTFKRFTASQRFEHMLLLITFTGLALTGLPQRYATQDWATWMIGAMGGIESIRIVHRILAVALMAGAIYHGGVVSFKWFVFRRGLPMLPGIRDLRDMLQWIAYNMGWRKHHPKMPRYNFGEKVEYLAVVWGTLIMILTGFMLWNPVATTSILPGSVVPAARLAHSAEALLAVLAIILWHMYNVHVRRFNRSMFTGELPREVMEEEHGEELEIIENGYEIPSPPLEVVSRRSLIFVPYGILMASLLTGGLVWFVSFEDTAIETIAAQPVSLEDAIADLTVDPSAGSGVEGAVLWRDLECNTCHGENGEGAPGPLNVPLAGTQLDFEYFVERVRVGPADMPVFGQVDVTDQELADIYVWLQSK